jgi:hypothetical protein
MAKLNQLSPVSSGRAELWAADPEKAHPCPNEREREISMGIK